MAPDEYNPWQRRYGSKGTPYELWRPLLPKFSDGFLDTSIFLYVSEEAALDPNHPHHILGGSGYLFGIPWEADKDLSLRARRYHVYAVTNKHVVVKSGAPVVRINTTDGGVEAFDFDIDDWTAHSAADLAVVRVPYSDKKHYGPYLEVRDVITNSRIRTFSFGLGDSVFSPGRFLNLTGQPRNQAVIRFGAVALMPSAKIGDEELILVEMRSRSGYSGSPVFIYIDPLTSRYHPKSENLPEKAQGRVMIGPWLLGTHSGQIMAIGPEIKDEAPQTGMSTVVPVSKLEDLLYMEKLVDERAQYEKNHLIVIVEESAQEVDPSDAKRDKILKKMLDTPPSPKK